MFVRFYLLLFKADKHLIIYRSMQTMMQFALQILQICHGQVVFQIVYRQIVVQSRVGL